MRSPFLQNATLVFNNLPSAANRHGSPHPGDPSQGNLVGSNQLIRNRYSALAPSG